MIRRCFKGLRLFTFRHKMGNKCNKFWTSRREPKCLNESQPYSRYAADIKGASSSESTNCTKDQWRARDKKTSELLPTKKTKCARQHQVSTGGTVGLYRAWMHRRWSCRPHWSAELKSASASWLCESVSLPAFVKTLRSRCCPTRLMEWITSTMITKKSVYSFLLA